MTLLVNLGRAEGRKFRAPPQRGAAAAGPGRARLGEGMGGGEARRYILLLCMGTYVERLLLPLWTSLIRSKKTSTLVSWRRALGRGRRGRAR